ncbi:hypothetical protein NGRA_0170 [Nosema granulosis]|uniref:DUF659 domain-containing protein n=1 Tax=Nosema granulosis TaxID=83296 RepID=A0A9P6H3H7_9MICR|nr:hypothetical protein NGRA_0170 [Nosema granulosis]
MIFLIVDESEIKKTRYFNILVVLITDTYKIYVLDFIGISDTPKPDGNLVCSYIDVCVERFEIKKENILLVNSDTASYMIKASSLMKKTYTNIFHVTCLAHLIHNCALKVKGSFIAVDNCIASIAALTIKNKTRAALLYEIGFSPCIILTRWSSWLKAALYYCKNLLIV